MPDIISTVGNGHSSPDYATLALYNAGDGGLDPGVGFTSIAECSGYLGATANINGTFIRGATIRGDIVFDGTNDSSLANTDRLTISSGSGINVEDLRIFTNNQFVSALNYNADFILMDRVVFDNETAGVNAIDINGAFTNGHIRNFVARGGADAVMAGFNQGTNLTNGLVYGAVDKGVEGSSSTPMVLTDIFSFNNGGQDIDSAGGFTLVDAATEDATGTYTGYTSAELVNLASGDLRTKSTSDLATLGTPFIGAFLESGGGGGEILAIDSGSYTLTGSNVSLTAKYKSTLESGSYSLSGSALGLMHDSKLIAGSGTYSLTGTQANLTAARKIIADNGSYNLTGTDVTLVYIPGGGGEVLSIYSGSFSLSGSDIGLKAARLIIANTGNYNLTGQSLALTYNAKTAVDSGSYSLNGSNVNLFANRVIIAVNGSYSLSGSSVILKYSGDTYKTIGTVTAGFAQDKYSAEYKPNTITVNFKD
tara:strand:+ start:335 stop:1771 length:1437 start_codon:yes stop_codon:yes gene_type:complete